MRGQVIVDKTTGRQWLYAPKAKLYFHALEGGDNKLIVVAFSSDGHFNLPDGPMPIEQWLEESFNFTTKLDIPKHIIDFARKSERERHEEVVAAEEILEAALGAKDAGTAFQEFLALHSLEPGAEQEVEHAIGLEIQACIVAARGHH